MMKQRCIASRKARVLLAARKIIQESGNFDLPMRDLAAAAEVSLRAPYEMFGSKKGIIQAILLEDIALFENEHSEELIDPVDRLFERLRLGIDLYRRHQPFYRALFREVQIDDSVSDLPATINLERKLMLCREMHKARIVRPDVSVELLAENLRNQFFAQMSLWANGCFDIDQIHWKTVYGWSVTLTGVATKARRDWLITFSEEALANYHASRKRKLRRSIES